MTDRFDIRSTRPSGRERLQVPLEFTAFQNSDSTGRLARQLDVETPQADALAQMLFLDLDRQRGAFRWWKPGGDIKQAMLVADHCVHAALALPDLLLEARIHFMELVDSWNRQHDKLQAHIRTSDDPYDYPPSRHLFDDLDLIQDDLHMAGVFRSTAQTMDCIAMLITVILDMPFDVHAASWGSIGQRLAADAKKQTSVGQAASSILATIQTSGPDHWLDWTLGMRHMMVHRPRLLDMVQKKRLGGTLVLPGLDEYDRAVTSHHLPREPARSLIESLIHGGGPDSAYLGEDAYDTLRGVIASTKQMIEGVSTALLHLWSSRRGSPSTSQQSNLPKQWKLKPVPKTPFEGYEPFRPPVDGVEAQIHPSLHARLEAGAVLDDRRTTVWGVT